VKHSEVVGVWTAVGASIAVAMGAATNTLVLSINSSHTYLSGVYHACHWLASHPIQRK
jgi:hypothetical protein